jgi:hypothetical protein
MPSPTTYTYSIQNNFINHMIDSSRLMQEINLSTIIIALSSIDTSGDSCNITFKDVLSDSDKATLDGLVAVHSGAPLPQNVAAPVQLYSGNTAAMPVLTDGRLRISAEKTNSSTVTFYSSDWTDKTTWYFTSTIVSNEMLTNSDGYYINYNTAHLNLIDTYHGKLTTEDFLKDAAGNSYRVSVWVDGVKKTEQDPHYEAGGDFTINYFTGVITFLTPLTSSNVVTATYHYAVNSIFTIAPSTGKQLRLSVVEIQFSDDVVITDTASFQPYGFVDYFAPQYMTTNGGPYPPGTKIPLGNPINYKTIQDYLNDSKKSYPPYPAMGGSGWRGIQRPSITMDWDYEGQKILRSDQGMEIRVSLAHNTPFGGGFATATFYCTSENLE